ncbi:membrane protein [Nocardioides szechwanensis]|uniref:Predicted Fe2+/Mn2+ transporter, VIT1/CCC1 family n=1 Tax=Nocardioides szechwanensis TaxID=1005944 RepID=A0A1H0CR05_9ACTN|nr:VIT family protein [Nocardioides szechwanensis]GEP33356.1 membrane protein [Nocardioides szechwanensis]SDN60300.1 Predicted Fe2+/Mn2+ transporter, VIT1/CCC1 family [Nocardioides szechwanensis]
MTADTADSPVGELGPHDDEPHETGIRSRLNWLRAGVLGANDGIVSTAGLVVGVAGATSDREAIMIAGIAGLVAGAVSMAAGEYVSVSTQRDSEKALLAKERRELDEDPEDELAELAGLYAAKGLSDETAMEVALQLTEHDALAAHADIELGIDPDDLTSAWNAAFASAIAFFLGALLPLLTITLSSQPARVPVTMAAVAVALAFTGWASARLGYGPPGRAVIRNVGGGLLAMGVTYLIGTLLGTTVL